MTIDGIGGTDRAQGAEAARDTQPMSRSEGWSVRADFELSMADRVSTLSGLNAVVERRETELQRQIDDGYHTAAGVTETRYREAARAHPDYAAQAAARTELASYLDANLPNLAPAMDATHGMLGGEAALIDQAGVELARASASGTADASLVSTLGSIAGHLSTGIDLGNEAAGDLMAARYAGLASGIGQSLGVFSSVATLVDGQRAITNGTANAGTYAQLAAETGALTVAGLAALGYSIPGAGTAAAVVGVAGGMYSEIADRNRYQADVAATLERAGIAPATAQALSQAQVGTLKAYTEAGLTPAQIAGIAAASPGALRQPGELTRALTEVTGLRGDALAGLVTAAGSGIGALVNRAGQIEAGYLATTEAREFLAVLERDARGIPPSLQSSVDYLRRLDR